MMINEDRKNFHLYYLKEDNTGVFLREIRDNVASLSSYKGLETLSKNNPHQALIGLLPTIPDLPERKFMENMKGKSGKFRYLFFVFTRTQPPMAS